jgi:hypothetical protein
MRLCIAWLERGAAANTENRHMHNVVCRQTGPNEWTVYRGAQTESVINREVFGNGPLYLPRYAGMVGVDGAHATLHRSLKAVARKLGVRASEISCDLGGQK